MLFGGDVLSDVVFDGRRRIGAGGTSDPGGSLAYVRLKRTLTVPLAPVPPLMVASVIALEKLNDCAANILVQMQERDPGGSRQ